VFSNTASAFDLLMWFKEHNLMGLHEDGANEHR